MGFKAYPSEPWKREVWRHVHLLTKQYMLCRDGDPERNNIFNKFIEIVTDYGLQPGEQCELMLDVIGHFHESVIEKGRKPLVTG